MLMSMNVLSMGDAAADRVTSTGWNDRVSVRIAAV